MHRDESNLTAWAATDTGDCRGSDGDGDEAGLSISRRTLLGAIGAGMALPAVATRSAGADPTPLDDDDWSIVALPDTQHYTDVDANKQFGLDQTTWIADNLDAQNIAFVSHEGDLVHSGDEDSEWADVDEFMGTLDGVVPYSVLPGNHDFETTGDRLSGAQGFKDTFPASRFDGSWFGGFGPAESASYEGPAGLNSYQTFSVGGYDFLHLALEWEPPGSVDDPDTPLGWAQEVLDAHRDYATIVTTHSYLRDLTEENGTIERTPPWALQEANDIGNTGEEVWEELIAPNPQIFMVLDGHFYRMAGIEDWHAGEGHLVDQNEAGEDVYQMLANYQWVENGGNGWLRLIRFRPGDGGSGAPDLIEVQTFTPSEPEDEWEPMWTDEYSTFSFSLDFDERFPDPITTVTFQDGENGYGGTTDTMIDADNPDTSSAEAPTVAIDADAPTQGLLRFDAIVGDGDDQVPDGVTIESATLTLECTNASISNTGNGVSAHRHLQPWAETDTWNSAFGGNGVVADDSVAASTADDSPDTSSTGPTAFDVTATVQTWIDGAENHGWAILPNGPDGWDFASSESTSAANPKLQVTYSVPLDGVGGADDDDGDEDLDQPGNVDGDGDIDDDDVQLVQRHISGQDVTMNESRADLDGDGDIDIVDAMGIKNNETGGGG